MRYYPPFMSQMFLRRTLRRLLPRSVALQIRRAWLGRRIAGGKGHFEDDVPLLETYVNSIDICWDIGANNGTYTRDEHNQLVEILVRVHERNYWFFPPGSTRSPAAVTPGARSTGPDVRA